METAGVTGIHNPFFARFLMLLQPLKYLIVVMGQMKQIFGCLVLFKASQTNKRILDMKIMLMVIM